MGRADDAASGERGAVAIEAALTIPLMVMIIITFLELFFYFRASAIVERAAFTVANGVAMQSVLSNRGQCTRSDDACTYGALMPRLLAPLDFSARGQLIISLYVADDDGNGVATWRDTPSWHCVGQRCGAGGAAESRVTAQMLAPAISRPIAAGAVDSMVVVEVLYTFEPFSISSRFWSGLGGPREIYRSAFQRPRFASLSELHT